ncbi:MAG: Nudix family hydrolase [Wenzhouxiangellaceae bacterium]|nr:Nudix family hydrolase [Wenzhouxiangellaceae bacterium]
MSAAQLEVVAAVLRDADGRVLLGQRPPGASSAGRWEFPGGKIEPGETAIEALARELREELGIAIGPTRPLAAIRNDDGAQPVRLWLFEVLRHDGEPTPVEGQALAWAALDELADYDLLPADRPLARLLALDGYYAIAPGLAELGSERALLEAWSQCLETGFRLLGLPLEKGHDLSSATVDALALACERAGAKWLVAGLPGICRDWPVDGLHLDTRALVTLDQRPLPTDKLLVASCHDLEEIRIAEALGVDLVTLSPIAHSPSHPGHAPLGWSDFERVIRHAPLPVLARGGLRPEDWARARELGAFGVAGVRAFGWT